MKITVLGYEWCFEGRHFVKSKYMHDLINNGLNNRICEKCFNKGWLKHG